MWNKAFIRLLGFAFIPAFLAGLIWKRTDRTEQPTADRSNGNLKQKSRRASEKLQ